VVELKEKCKLCFGTKFEKSENDIVCTNCGSVVGVVESQQTVTPKYNISLTAEAKLGSSNIIDPSLSLLNLNKKFTSKILNSTDVYLEAFSQSCDDLFMPKTMARNAFYLFQKLRHAKLGLGKTAVFCIVQAYTSADALYDVDLLIQTIKNRFKLKREITLSQTHTTLNLLQLRCI